MSTNGALSGTAYAATLPRNSVGTAQLKRNAVTSAKVRDGSGVAIAAGPGATAVDTVSCAPGEVAVSGGGFTGAGNAVLTDPVSIQAAPTAPPTGWELDYRNDQAAADMVAAEVVCATP